MCFLKEFLFSSALLSSKLKKLDNTGIEYIIYIHIHLDSCYSYFETATQVDAHEPPLLHHSLTPERCIQGQVEQASPSLGLPRLHFLGVYITISYTIIINITCIHKCYVLKLIGMYIHTAILSNIYTYSICDWLHACHLKCDWNCKIQHWNALLQKLYMSL